MKKPEPTPESEINFEIEGKQIIEILQDKNVMSQLFEIEKDYPYWESFKYKVKSLTDYDAKHKPFTHFLLLEITPRCKHAFKTSTKSISTKDKKKETYQKEVLK